MNETQSDKEEEFGPWHTALCEAMRMWPDPFMAPEVPSREELRVFLNSAPEERPRWLAEQLQSSPNGVRAIDVLALEGLEATKPSLSWVPRELLAEESAIATPPTNPVVPDAPKPEPEPGQVWSTAQIIMAPSGDGTSQNYKVWDPVPVLIVSIPVAAGSDRVARAVAVSYAEHWPEEWRSSGDIPIQLGSDSPEDLVAHTWLEYPVSVDQLANCAGTVDDASLEAVAAAGGMDPEGLELEEADDQESLSEEAVLERDRLTWRAGFLSMTADTRAGLRTAWAVEEIAEEDEPDPSVIIPFPKNPQELAACMARNYGGTRQQIIGQQDYELGLAAATGDRWDVLILPERPGAAVEVQLRLAEEQEIGAWVLAGAPPDITDKWHASLHLKGSGELIASGKISRLPNEDPVITADVDQDDVTARTAYFILSPPTT